MKHFNKLLYLFVCLFLIDHLLLIQRVFITCLINWSFDVLTDLHEGAWRRRKDWNKKYQAESKASHLLCMCPDPPARNSVPEGIVFVSTSG